MGTRGDWDATQARIEEMLLESSVPGVAIAWVGAGGQFWSGGLGLADVEARRPVTADTFFRAASVSKCFCSLALVQLAEDGAVSLQARVRDVAPEVVFTNPWEATQPLLVAHLLEHTSGFDASPVNQDYDFGRSPRPLREVVESTAQSRVSRWPPGARMSYRSQNYLIAGHLIERLSGRSFEEHVAARVFAPLGMSNSAFFLTPAAQGALAQGYRGRRRRRRAAYQELLIRPSTGLLSSAREISAFLRLCVGRGAVDGRRLVSEAGVERIEQTATLPYGGPEQRYGLGNDLEQFEGFLGRGHNGITDGFTTSFRYFPKHSVGWVLLFNHENAGAVRGAIEREVVRFLLPQPQTASRPSTQVREDGLRQWAGFYRSPSAPYEVLAFADRLFGGIRLSVKDGALVERRFRAPSRRWLPLSEQAFGLDGESVSSRWLLTDSSGRRAVVTGSDYLEECSWPRALVGRTLFLAALVVAGTTFADALLWLPATLGGQLSTLRLLFLALPVTAALILYSLPVLLIRSPQRLGQRNATTRIARWLTWAFFLSATASVGVAGVAIANRDDRPLALAYGALASSACGGLAWFFVRAGWIGIRLWER